MIRLLLDRLRSRKEIERKANIREQALKVAAIGHAEAEASRRRRRALAIEVSVVRSHRGIAK